MDELDNLTFIPNCTCNCACGNATLQARKDNITKVSQFLMGLNSQFSTVRSQFLLIPNLPFLNESYALLLQEEEQKACASSHFEYNSQESTAFMVKKFGNTKSKAKLVCDYCKDTRHTRDSCFVLNGYPP